MGTRAAGAGTEKDGVEVEADKRSKEEEERLDKEYIDQVRLERFEREQLIEWYYLDDEGKERGPWRLVYMCVCM